MKASSCRVASIANALERSSALGISRGHSTRMQAPSGGSDAPAANASATVTDPGARPCAARAKATIVAGNASASGASTRRMPTRSIRRPSGGCANPTPTA